MSGATTTDTRAALFARVFGPDNGFVCIASGWRNGDDLADFRQAYYRYPDEIAAALAEIEWRKQEGREVYHCAHLLTHRRRKKENAARLWCAYSDVDNADLSDALLAPSILIESSPGRFQAYWRFTHSVEPAVAEALNHRFALALGADQSGWDLTQLLRLPGTRNHKYGGSPEVRLIHLDDSLVYDPDELDRLLPPLPKEKLPSSNGSTGSHAGTGALSDPQLLSKAMGAKNGDKVRRLYAGDITGYKSQSEAESAFCVLIAFYSQDLAQIDRLYRGSGLFREKWDERHYADGRTYGQVTIEKAILHCTEHWTPPAEAIANGATPSAGQSRPRPDSSDVELDLLPTFPTDVLPGAVRRYVEEGAEALNVAADMIALPLLGFAGGVIGSTRAIVVKAGWIERPQLWLAIVGDPGSGKSPAIDYARRPVDALQKKAIELYCEDLEQWEEEAAEARANKQAPPDKPKLNHYFTTDATMEALAVILDHSPGVALLREELVGWVKSHDAYRKAGDRQNWLSLWAGAPLKVDRKGSGTIYVPWPCVPVVGGIQPELLSDLAEEANRRDGFVDRLLPIWPASKAMLWNDAPLNEATAWEVNHIFADLRRRPLPGEHHLVRFSVEAKQAFARWYDENAGIVNQTSGLAAGCYAKYPGQLARIILILHALRHPKEPTRDVDVDTVGDGIAVIEYLRAHLSRVLPAFQAVGSERSAALALRVLRVLTKARQTTPDGWVSRRDLHKGLGRSVAAADLDAVLITLEGEGTVENRVVHTGARPREESRTVMRTNEHMNNSGAHSGECSYVHLFDGAEEEIRV